MKNNASFLVCKPGMQLIAYDGSKVRLCYYGDDVICDLKRDDFPIAKLLDFLKAPMALGRIVAKISHESLEPVLIKLLEGGVLLPCSDSDARAFKNSENMPGWRLLLRKNGELGETNRRFALLKQKSVELVFLSNVETRAEKIFADVGLSARVANSLEDSLKADCRVVIADWNKIADLKTLNGFYIQNSKPYFLICMDPFGGLVGPELGRAGGPCFECLTSRGFTLPAEFCNSETTDYPFANILLTSAALEIFNLLDSSLNQRLRSHCLEFDMTKPTFRLREVLPKPRCSHCQKLTIGEDRAHD